MFQRLTVLGRKAGAHTAVGDDSQARGRLGVADEKKPDASPNAILVVVASDLLVWAYLPTGGTNQLIDRAGTGVLRNRQGPGDEECGGGEGEKVTAEKGDLGSPIGPVSSKEVESPFQVLGYLRGAVVSLVGCVESKLAWR